MPDRPSIELLPASRNLSAWIRSGGKPERSGRSFLWRYRWSAFWFDINWTSQERLYPASTRGECSLDPVFILGLWRSGTTYLHELLTASLGWNSPKTWQCFNPSAFRLGKEPASAAAVQRPMDAVEINAQSPQEDEFVLLAKGADSAYRFFLDPRRWRELMPAISFERWQNDVHGLWLNDLRSFLGWCDTGCQIPLVVKSPGHIFRIDALRKAWPNARRIWIVRDPVEIWHSNLRMWHAMAQRYALWHWKTADLTDFLNECFRAYSTVLEHVLVNPRIFADAVIPYQSLIDNPEQCLRTIIETTALSPRVYPHRLSEAVALYARPVSAATEAEPPAKTRNLLNLIHRQHQALLRDMQR